MIDANTKLYYLYKVYTHKFILFNMYSINIHIFNLNILLLSIIFRICKNVQRPQIYYVTNQVPNPTFIKFIKWSGICNKCLLKAAAAAEY